MAVAGKPIFKKIYFVNFNDIDYFTKKIESTFTIFDKELAVTLANVKIPGEKALASYIKNGIILKELTKTLKDKKVMTVIYILHNSSAKSIISNIQEHIIPAINKNIKFSYYLIPDTKKAITEISDI